MFLTGIGNCRPAPTPTPTDRHAPDQQEAARQQRSMQAAMRRQHASLLDDGKRLRLQRSIAYQAQQERSRVADALRVPVSAAPDTEQIRLEDDHRARVQTEREVARARKEYFDLSPLNECILTHPERFRGLAYRDGVDVMEKRDAYIRTWRTPEIAEIATRDLFDDEKEPEPLSAKVEQLLENAGFPPIFIDAVRTARKAYWNRQVAEGRVVMPHQHPQLPQQAQVITERLAWYPSGPSYLADPSGVEGEAYGHGKSILEVRNAHIGSWLDDPRRAEEATRNLFNDENEPGPISPLVVQLLRNTGFPEDFIHAVGYLRNLYWHRLYPHERHRVKVADHGASSSSMPHQDRRMIIRELTPSPDNVTSSQNPSAQVLNSSSNQTDNLRWTPRVQFDSDEEE